MLVIYFLLLISTINFLEFKKYLVVLAFYITTVLNYISEANSKRRFRKF